MVTDHLRATSLSARHLRHLRWLVIAPHPDDETLGAGALIHQTARERRLAAVAFLTDGSGSHPASAGRRLVTVRQREAALALRRLGTGPIPTVHLGWRDGSPAQAGKPQFERTRRRLAALCETGRVDAIAVTATHEPHCDHEAAAHLAYAVRDACRRSVRVLEYVVWGDGPPPVAHVACKTAAMPPGLRRRALSAHRSQTGASQGDGFRLPGAMRRMPPIDILYQTGH